MLVTLLTDFGTADYFVGAMKGAVLSVNPSAQVVDITHEVPAFDVEAGAFALLAAFEAFPKGTVHVAVVDPGVGSQRRPLAVEGGGHLFVGPDNGVFGHVCERLKDFRAFHLTNELYFRKNVSSTFHGRDIFAPVAAAL
ncbi:MAG TPA: SAM-dependent chlorinase/fluorinase, partial [Pyrinomonadaceae bacterium]|nr:SAM-dependent chlorinase/fluorinase [Pyrinomonadaceae bacterium]